jgi:hypothetical protein
MSDRIPSPENRPSAAKAHIAQLPAVKQAARMVKSGFATSG